jgi:hypothetical protein
MAEENLTGQTGLRRETCTLHQMNRGDAAVEERVKAVYIGGVHLIGMYLEAAVPKPAVPELCRRPISRPILSPDTSRGKGRQETYRVRSSWSIGPKW